MVWTGNVAAASVCATASECATARICTASVRDATIIPAAIIPATIIPATSIPAASIPVTIIPATTIVSARISTGECPPASPATILPGWIPSSRSCQLPERAYPRTGPPRPCRFPIPGDPSNKRRFHGWCPIDAIFTNSR